MPITRNLSYGPFARNKYDLYEPAGADPKPTVIIIHGGSWLSGDKSKDPITYAANVMASKGFRSAAINYRYSSTDPWDAQYEDVVAAADAIAARLGSKSSRMTAFGFSVGGHLACWGGLAGKFVRIADACGPHDLTAADLVNPIMTPAINALCPTGDKAAASPIFHATAAFPPIQLWAGSNDTTVPKTQAETMQAALAALGVAATLKPYTGTHNFGGLSSSALNAVYAEIATFLKA